MKTLYGGCLIKNYFWKWQCHRSLEATENAGVENAIRLKMNGWKMQEWKMREQIAGVENAGIGKPYGKPNRYYSVYIERPLSYFLKIVLRLLSE